MSEPSSTPKSTAPPTALLCRVVDNVNGTKATYFLDIHSGAFDFSSCNVGIARIPIHVADPAHPFDGLPQGLTRRCYYSTTTDHSVKGTVTILSTTETDNLAAVTALCNVHHGVP